MGKVIKKMSAPDLDPESKGNSSEEVRATAAPAFKTKQQKAFVLGASGEVGQELVKSMVNSDLFASVTLIGRRKLDFSAENDKFQNLNQSVIDFEKMMKDEHNDEFSGFDVGFCCLGTTRSKAGKDGFKRVDHDYTVKAAKLAKKGGCTQYHQVSSSGADKNSFNLYLGVKGQVDAEVAALGFERLSIYRPGVLMCDRKESRPAEWIIRKMFAPLAYFFPTSSGNIPTYVVAQGMLANCDIEETGSSDTTAAAASTIYSNKQIHHLGAKFRKIVLKENK